MVVKVIDFSKASASPLNPLSAKVRQYLWDELHHGLRDANVTSMIVTGGLVNFSAGADLTEFASFSSAVLSSSRDTKEKGPPSLIDVVQALEGSNKPIVAAIAGACLGGGCEVALACHYRVALASSSTQLGLPEVHVGVIPGAGGTQRMPKAVGLATACQMILTGVPLKAQAALKAKLVDDVVAEPNALMEKAEKWASWAEVMPLKDRRLGQKPLMESAPMAHVILQQAELSLPKLGAGGFQAALRAMRASYLPLEVGMEVEKKEFLETLVSQEGKARRHAFFAIRQAQKLVHPELAKLVMQHPLLQQKTSSKTPLPTAVIGAGTMGTGIAIVLLQAGFQVTLVDVQEKALEKGVATIRQTLESQVQRKKLQPAVAESMIGRLAFTTKLDDLGQQCALVVEAAIETMKIKQTIFSTLDRVTPLSCVLVSNTSTLDIDAMASVLQPDRQAWFLGWHFFSPANIMKLVEVVRGTRTCPQAITLLQLLSKQVGKIGVVVGNCDGFCGNRLLRPYSLESAYLIEEGSATIRDTDRAILDFGVALGPFGLADLAGNDVGYNIRRERGWTRTTTTTTSNTPSQQEQEQQRRPARYSEVADIMVTEYGRLGQKVGKGWYDYDPSIGKGRIALDSKEMETLIQSRRRLVGDKEPESSEEIVRRCFYPLVNEGFKCLEEGIALRPSDIDVIYVHGYGWPVWRGGPMHWADHQVGLATLLSWLQTMSQKFPTTDHFVPSALLVECVQKETTVEKLYQQKEKEEEQERRSKL